MKQAINKTLKNLSNSMPLIIGMMLLVSFITTIVPDSFYISLFQKGMFVNSIIGSLIGSISMGSPIVSYVLAGEFLAKGISIVAVTAFLISWVTVGIIQLPIESIYLGKKFAIIRNISAIILSVISAFIVYIFLI
jgi:uncharacterized membrane protein YraQ (UPF0718 family)